VRAGWPTRGIGLSGISSAVNRNSHKTFHVDQQRRIDAASWVSAYCANAVRIDSVVMFVQSQLRGVRLIATDEDHGDGVEVLSVGLEGVR
jgi:hypothetical protein